MWLIPLTTGEITEIKGKKTFRSFKTDLFIKGVRLNVVMIYSCFLVTIFPTNRYSSIFCIKTYTKPTTPQSLWRRDKPKTSAFKLFTVANSRAILSNQSSTTVSLDVYSFYEFVVMIAEHDRYRGATVVEWKLPRK